MKKTLLSMCCAVALGLTALTASTVTGLAQEKKDKSLSDRTVRVIMGYALAGIPDELPDPKGKMVKIDKSDANRFMIPISEAKEIIVQATLSARADLCGLSDIQKKHFESIMRHQRNRKNKKGERLWSPYQMTYIDVLIAATSNVMTGSSLAGEEAKKKADGSQDIREKYECSSAEREKAKADVEADIKRLAQAQ